MPNFHKLMQVQVNIDYEETQRYLEELAIEYFNCSKKDLQHKIRKQALKVCRETWGFEHGSRKYEELFP